MSETFLTLPLQKSFEVMCTVNIKIDNEKVCRINPNLKNNDNIECWVQYCMDEFIDTLSSGEHMPDSPNAHSASWMCEILQGRIRRAEAGKEQLVLNTEVFAQID